MKIVLTGPNGNLGQALQRQGQQHRWFGVDRSDWAKLPEMIEQADCVIHAASDHLTPVWQDPAGVVNSNIDSTVRLLEQLKNKQKCRLVFISSCAVYGRSELTREDMQPTPLSVNGITKFLNENLISEYARHHNLDYKILRVFNTFGGHDRFSIVSHLHQSLKQRKPFTLFNQGISQRDFIHVDDVAHIILDLIERPVNFRTLNIGSGEATKIRDIVQAFQVKHPALEVVHKEREEAEYSRADISRLRELMPGYSFYRVLDYIREEL